MRLPDGTELMHGPAPYDPVKAHEYYIRTRKLKGRKKGATPPKSSALVSRRNDSFKVNVDGKEYTLSPQQLQEQRAYAAQRVQSIKKKLHELNAKLKEKMAAAKKAEREAKKPDSASEKAEKARESKKYRDKHKQELKNKSKKASSEKKPSTDSVEGLKKTIEDAQRSLKKAIARQRSLASATKN